MEGEDLTQSDPSVVTSDLPPVDPSTPGEPYLAPRYISTTSHMEAVIPQWYGLE